MADVSTVRELIRLSRHANVSLYIWGVHGLGKSSLVRQTTADLGIGFVDFRCAQIEASDLRGLPDKGADGRTHFLPPAELPVSGEGILFLDELNRASAEVLAAAFQLVLDRRIGSYELPPGWSIVGAGNLDNGDYLVSELDPALRDRFCHVLLSSGQPTFDEWAGWMFQQYSDSAQGIVGFCGDNLQHLEVVENEDLGFRVTPSRRSWEMVARILRAWQQGSYSQRARLEAMAGLVGRDLAIAFDKHHAAVTPQELLKLGVTKLAEKIRNLGRNQTMALMWGLASYAKDSLHEERIAEVVLDFVELLLAQEKDLAIGFCAAVVSTVAPGQVKLPPAQAMALLMNPRLGSAVAQVNHRQKHEPRFIDRLTARPQLAVAVAESMALEPRDYTEIN